MPSKGQSIHRYTAQQRQEALRLSDDLEVAKAAAKLGMPGGTIASWRWSRTHLQGSTATPTASKSVSATTEVIDKPVESATVTKATRRVAKVYTPSQKAEALEMLSVKGPAETSRALRISRFSLFEWARKHRGKRGSASYFSALNKITVSLLSIFPFTVFCTATGSQPNAPAHRIREKRIRP
jgi:hypothetical protein